MKINIYDGLAQFYYYNKFTKLLSYLINFERKHNFPKFKTDILITSTKQIAYLLITVKLLKRT